MVAGAQRALDAFALPVRQMLELCARRWTPKRDQRAGGPWAAVPGANSRPAACFTALRWVGLSHDVVFAHDVE